MAWDYIDLSAIIYYQQKARIKVDLSTESRRIAIQERNFYMTPKEKLYYLLNRYLIGEYNTNIFCDLFTDTFNLERDDSLNKTEEQLFGELMRTTSRFSPYEEDLKIPNAFSDEQEVQEKAKEIAEKLSSNKI